MRFLDPACGSGNFLTETYISLRRLENEILNELQRGQIVLGEAINPIQVSIGQFYGIEINDFAVTVAKTALWIAESQMMKETEDIVHMSLDFLPLKSYANITEGNALRMELLEFEINNIENSILNLSKEKKEIDFNTLQALYMEAKIYLPELQKKFEDLVDFHNSMIQNRIDFIQEQLRAKQQLHTQYSNQLQEILLEKEKITVEALDEGLLDELNMLNRKIEKLSLKKGEITQSIHLLEEQGQVRRQLNDELDEIEKQMKDSGIEEKTKIFNQIFADYCEKLYGEKYLLDYNPKWKEEKKFPVSISALGGNVGTGKKKAVIVAYDLAYMQYSIKMGINVPQFVIHDKMENTHINQLKTIFQICNEIDGQYIIPILRERIDKIDQEYIDKAKILELSTDDKFFKI